MFWKAGHLDPHGKQAAGMRQRCEFVVGTARPRRGDIQGLEIGAAEGNHCGAASRNRKFGEKHSIGGVAPIRPPSKSAVQ